MINLSGYFYGGDKKETFHIQAKDKTELMRNLIDLACIYIYQYKNLCLPFNTNLTNTKAKYMELMFSTSNTFSKEDFYSLWKSSMYDLENKSYLSA